MIGEMENETRKGTREWRDGRRSIRRTGYRIEDARGGGAHSHMCSRGTREINGSRNRQKPVRGQKTRCRHRLNCRRAIRGERREEKERRRRRRKRSRIETREGENGEKAESGGRKGTW